MAGALAVAGEAVSLAGFGQAPSRITLWSVMLPVVMAFLIASLSAASVAVSGSLTVGLAVSLMPLSVASSWLGLLMALAATSSALTTAVISYVALRLRQRPCERANSAAGTLTTPPSPTALAASSLALYLLWAFRAPIISGLLIGQVAYAATAAAAAALASLSSQDVVMGLVKGLAASLGPLGLALVAAVNGLEADEPVRLF